MKILILSKLCSYPSSQGSAQHARTFADSLIKNNIDVQMVSAEYVNTYQSCFQDGYLLHKIPMKKNSDIVKNFTENKNKNDGISDIASTIIDSFKPDVIHVGVPIFVTDFIIYSKLKKIPIIAIVHSFEWMCMQKFLLQPNNEICTGPSIEKCERCLLGYMSKKRRALIFFLNIFNLSYFSRFFPKKLYEKIIFKNRLRKSLKKMYELVENIDLFLVQTDASKKIMSQMGVPEIKMKVLKQWLVDEKLSQKIKLKTNKGIKFGYIGNMNNVKGVSTIFKALKQIKNKDDIELWILSNGITKAKIERLFGKEYKNKFKVKLFPNLQKNSDLTETIAKLDVCLIPSIWLEVGPRVLLEAIAQKVPCITSHTVGNNYLINNNINGKIFTAGSSSELTQIINELINSPEIMTNWEKKLPEIRSIDDWYPEIIEYHHKMIR